jgi:glycosyltransferase involved in cell wall biosynthesis
VTDSESSVDRGVTQSDGVRLTVVVTTYERPDYLRESLASIAAQSARGSFRVVVLDNASSADYSDVIAEYTGTLGLQYVRNEANLGAAGNIERALERYRSTEYVTVFHDDDLMHPRMLEWQMQIMDADPEILFVATQCAIFEDGTPPPVDLLDGIVAPAHDVYPDAAGFVRCILSGCEPVLSSVMYRTSALGDVQFDFERLDLYCDRPYLVDIASHGKSALITAPLVLYRTHADQDSVSGALTFRIMVELMKSYREELDVERDAGDRELFMSHAVEFLLLSYRVLRDEQRPSLLMFLYRTRRSGVFGPTDLSREQWSRVLQASGHGWVPRVAAALKRGVRTVIGR